MGEWEWGREQPSGFPGGTRLLLAANFQPPEPHRNHLGLSQAWLHDNTCCSDMQKYCPLPCCLLGDTDRVLLVHAPAALLISSSSVLVMLALLFLSPQVHVTLAGALPCLECLSLHLPIRLTCCPLPFAQITFPARPSLIPLAPQPCPISAFL